MAGKISPNAAGAATFCALEESDNPDALLAEFGARDSKVAPLAEACFSVDTSYMQSLNEHIKALSEVSKDLKKKVSELSRKVQKICTKRAEYENALLTKAANVEDIGSSLDCLMGKKGSREMRLYEDLKQRKVELSLVLEGKKACQARKASIQREASCNLLDREAATSAPPQAKVSLDHIDRETDAASAPPEVELGRGATAKVVRVSDMLARKIPLSPRIELPEAEFIVAECDSPLVPKGNKSSPDRITKCLDMEKLTPLKRGDVTPSTIRKLVTSTLEALLDIYQRTGLRHLDVKVENLFLDARSNVKLGDWGNARRDGEGAVSGSLFNTPPEVFQENPKVTEKQDSFAIGILIYQAVTGKMHPLAPETIYNEGDLAVPIAALAMPVEDERSSKLRDLHTARYRAAIDQAVKTAQTKGMDPALIDVMIQGLKINPTERMGLKEAQTRLKRS